MVAVSIKVSRRELNAIYVLAVVGGIVAAVTAYLSMSEGGRGAITIGQQATNPNSVSSALLIPAALTVGAFVNARGTIQRVGTICALGVIGLGMYSSMTRGALVGLAAMFAAFAYRLRARRAIIIVPLVILVAVAGAMPETFFDRIIALYTGEDSTGSNRTEIWKVGMTALKEYWLVGAGFANFETVYTTIAPVGPRGAGAGAHNTYLMVWVGLGIVGLTVMLTAVTSHFLAIRRVRTREVTLVALEAACFGMMGLAIVGEELFAKPFWLAWILLSWAVSRGSSAEEPLGAVPLRVEPRDFAAAPSRPRLLG
jgi:O-antigen ligase